MTAPPKRKLTVGEFLDWAGRQNGKYELVRGEIFAMGREAIQHARVKRAAADALTAAIKHAGLPQARRRRGDTDGDSAGGKRPAGPAGAYTRIAGLVCRLKCARQAGAGRRPASSMQALTVHSDSV
jgi:hypothetical protein